MILPLPIYLRFYAKDFTLRGRDLAGKQLDIKLKLLETCIIQFQAETIQSFVTTFYLLLSGSFHGRVAWSCSPCSLSRIAEKY